MALRPLSKGVSIKFSFFSLMFVFVVVLFHSDFRYYYPFIEDLTAVSTSFFFCVSAFFFYRGLHPENFSSRLKKRVFTLLIPYLLWNLLYLILYTVDSNLTIPDILRAFTVSPQCTPSWYLFTLFLFFLPAPLIMRALNKSYSTGILLLAGIGISYLGYLRFQLELASVPVVGGYLVRMTEYVTPHLIGAIIGTWFSEKIYTTWKHCLIGIICSCAIIILLFCNIPSEMRWLLWVIFPLTLWESIPEIIFDYVGFLKFFTAPGFWINMTHCYLLYMWAQLTANSNIATGKYLSAIQVVLTVAIAYVLFYLLKLVLPKVLQILTGNRIRES